MYTRKRYGGQNSTKMNGSTKKMNGNTKKMNGNTKKMNGNTKKMNGSTKKMNKMSGSKKKSSRKSIFRGVKVTKAQCKLPPAKCINIKPTQADMEEISKYSGISILEIKKVFKNTSAARVSSKKSLSMQTSPSGSGLWKGMLPSNIVQNSICIFLLILVGTSVGYVLSTPALRMLTWINLLPELCSQNAVEWVSRKAASKITGVLSCHDAAEQFRSQLTLISASLVGAGITQELLLHHYSLAKDAVKAHIFGTPEEQQLINTRIAAAEARRQAQISRDQLQAQQELDTARTQAQAQIAAIAALPTTPASAVPPAAAAMSAAAAVPAAAVPAAAVPSTAVPSTAVPAAAVPSTAVPSTAVPSTAVPAAAVPSTAVPSAAVPSTAVPASAQSRKKKPLKKK